MATKANLFGLGVRFRGHDKKIAEAYEKKKASKISLDKGKGMDSYSNRHKFPAALSTHQYGGYGKKRAAYESRVGGQSMKPPLG